MSWNIEQTKSQGKGNEYYKNDFVTINKYYTGYRLELVRKDTSVEKLSEKMPAKEFKAFLKGIIFTNKFK
jgi:hypothetical protein